eukprot:EG_transcript_31801
MPLLAGGEAGFRDGPVAQARFRNPALLALDSNGDLFIGDFGNNRIRKLTLADEVTAVAGSGQLGWRDGPVLEAQFRAMGCFSLDPRRPGALVAVEFLLHCILSIDLAGVVTVMPMVDSPPQIHPCVESLVKTRHHRQFDPNDVTSRTSTGEPAQDLRIFPPLRASICSTPCMLSR